MASKASAAARLGDGATPPAVSKYVLLHNPTAQIQHVSPDEGERNRKNILVLAFDTLALTRKEYAEWIDDPNLLSALASGVLVLGEGDAKPRTFPKEPASGLSDPEERMVIALIVYGPDEQARQFIDTTLSRDRSQADARYMRTNFVSILKAAHKWLKQWGPPSELMWRLGAIEQRLGQLKQDIADSDS